MADIMKRRTEEVLKLFVDLGDYFAEKIVVVNPDGSPVGGGGGGGDATEATLQDILAAIGDLGLQATLLEIQIAAGTTNITLGDILAALSGTLTVDGTVALDAATLTALENITAAISGTVTVAEQKASTATLSNVNDSGSNQDLLAANANRLGVMIVNDSDQDLYLKYGNAATATSYTAVLPAGSYWEMPKPIYTGDIDGIWAADGTGAARITELTA